MKSVSNESYTVAKWMVFFILQEHWQLLLGYNLSCNGYPPPSNIQGSEESDRLAREEGGGVDCSRSIKSLTYKEINRGSSADFGCVPLSYMRTALDPLSSLRTDVDSLSSLRSDCGTSLKK